MATQSERREATSKRLIDAAQRLFVADGYEATSTEAILEAAGTSRGAMYHHFPTKEDLFAAVFERVSHEAIDRAVARAAPTGSPLQALIEGCLAWLREARRAETAAILLDQGPQVLGWLRARELENKYSLGLMKQSVRRAVEAGELDLVSIDLTAGMINAALAELALQSLHAKERLRAGVADASIRQLIEGLASTPVVLPMPRERR